MLLPSKTSISDLRWLKWDFGSGLVSMSASWASMEICEIVMDSYAILSQIKWYSRFLLEWNIAFAWRYVALRLSHSKCGGFTIIQIFVRNMSDQQISTVMDATTRYSAYVEFLATVWCSLEHQYIGIDPKKII